MSANAILPPPEILSDADMAANQQLDRRFTLAVSHKDVDEVMSCFCNSLDTTLVMYDGTVFRGWQTIRQFFARVCADFDSLQLTVDEVTHFRAGDCVLAVGTATWRMKPRAGESTILTERWTDVRRKVGGEWVYVLDHAHALGK